MQNRKSDEQTAAAPVTGIIELTEADKSQAVSMLKIRAYDLIRSIESIRTFAQKELHPREEELIRINETIAQLEAPPPLPPVKEPTESGSPGD